MQTQTNDCLSKYNQSLKAITKGLEEMKEEVLDFLQRILVVQ